MQRNNSLQSKGVILLILVNIISATTFPLTKDIVSNLSPSTLIGARFLIASIFFAGYLRKLNLFLVRDGIIIGLLLFFYLAIETVALGTIPANRAVFIASLSVIIVPLLGLLTGQRVMLKTFLASGLAVIGLAALFWEGGEIGIGDMLMLADSLVYAAYILFLERVATRHPTLPLTGIQLFFIGGLGLVWSNSHIFNEIEAIDQHWQAILYLALIATAVTISLQTLAQQWVSAYETALLYALEPLFSVFFSFWLLGEQLGIRGIIGAIFVLSGVLISQFPQGETPEETKPDSLLQSSEPLTELVK